MTGARMHNSVPEAAAGMRSGALIPRAHGAWAMLLQPFVAALLVYHRVSWAVRPALAAVVLVFLIRDPPTILARQKWVWRGERPESAVARRYLAVEFLLLAMSGGLLLII